MIKHKTTQKTKVFRRDIQALRAVAVAAVVVYHLWPGSLRGGFTGVDIFFVISGYLMTVSIMKRLTPLADKRAITVRSTFTLLVEFYSRRIKRLVPAALVTLTGVLALATPSGNLDILLTNTKNVISAATFWQNWFLANDALDYLHQDNMTVATQHFWSLSLEEQFYLLWPLLLVATTFITLNIVVLWKRKKIPGVIMPVALVTLLSLAYGVWLTASSPTIAYYSTPARVWELMIGGIIALLPAIKNYDLKLLVPYAGFIICLYSLFFVDSSGFPGWAALLPTVGTALIIWAGADRAESRFAFDNVFHLRPIQWLGNISYSIYLWHFPFIVLLPVLFHFDLNGSRGDLLKAGIITLTLIIAQLSYRYIELPAQRIKARKVRYIYLIFVVATTVIVGLAFGLRHYAKAQVQTNLDRMSAAVLNVNDDCIGARALVHRANCKNPFGQINPSFMSVGHDSAYINRIQDGSAPCYAFWVGENDRDDTSKYCVFGDTKAERTFILFGDSHAEQYVNAFNDIGKRNHYKVYLFNLGQCTNGEAMDQFQLCKDRLNFFTSSGLLNTSSFIVVSVLFRNYNDTEELLSTLKQHTDTPFMLLGDVPRIRPDTLKNCYTLLTDCQVPRAEATQEVDAFTQLLVDKRIVNSNQIIDLNDGFCDAATCYAAIGNLPVYHESGLTAEGITNAHITAHYALTLSTLIETKLQKHGFIK